MNYGSSIDDIINIDSVDENIQNLVIFIWTNSKKKILKKANDILGVIQLILQ